LTFPFLYIVNLLTYNASKISDRLETTVLKLVNGDVSALSTLISSPFFSTSNTATSSSSATSAKFAFFITKEMKLKLLELGYSNEAILHMQPAQAQRIISEGLSPTTLQDLGMSKEEALLVPKVETVTLKDVQSVERYRKIF
jgi:hypothetical protein